MQGDELIARIRILLHLSQRSYDLYLQSGRTLHFARLIKRYNAAVRDVLVEGGHIIPADRRDAAADLFVHLESWLAQWDAHYEQTKPDESTVFAFDTAVKFPKDSVDRLIS